MKYKLSNFNYDLPEKRIVDKPCEQRDEAKMMVLDMNFQAKWLVLLISLMLIWFGIQLSNLTCQMVISDLETF